MLTCKTLVCHQAGGTELKAAGHGGCSIALANSSGIGDTATCLKPVLHGTVLHGTLVAAPPLNSQSHGSDTPVTAVLKALPCVKGAHQSRCPSVSQFKPVYMILPHEPVGSFRGRWVYPGHVSEVSEVSRILHAV
jgi:hypothetical protein